MLPLDPTTLRLYSAIDHDKAAPMSHPPPSPPSYSPFFHDYAPAGPPATSSTTSVPLPPSQPPPPPPPPHDPREWLAPRLGYPMMGRNGTAGNLPPPSSRFGPAVVARDGGVQGYDDFGFPSLDPGSAATTTTTTTPVAATSTGLYATSAAAVTTATTAASLTGYYADHPHPHHHHARAHHHRQTYARVHPHHPAASTWEMHAEAYAHHQPQEEPRPAPFLKPPSADNIDPLPLRQYHPHPPSPATQHPHHPHALHHHHHHQGTTSTASELVTTVEDEMYDARMLQEALTTPDYARQLGGYHHQYTSPFVGLSRASALTPRMMGLSTPTSSSSAGAGPTSSVFDHNIVSGLTAPSPSSDFRALIADVARATASTTTLDPRHSQGRLGSASNPKSDSESSQPPPHGELLQRVDGASRRRKRRGEPAAPRVCRIEGCTKGIRSRGLCKAHGGGRRCMTPGCTTSDQGGGHCVLHGGGRRCNVEGCTKSAQWKGVCKMHGGARRCRYQDCTKNGQVKEGYCRAHHNLITKQRQEAAAAAATAAASGSDVPVVL